MRLNLIHGGHGVGLRDGRYRANGREPSSPRSGDNRSPPVTGRSPDIQRGLRPAFLVHRRNAAAQKLKSQLTQENSEMISNIARAFVLSVVSAGIIVGAALGMAGMANAATQTQPSGPGYSYAPAVKAHPAPEAVPGWHGHHGADRIQHFVPGYHR